MIRQIEKIRLGTKKNKRNAWKCLPIRRLGRKKCAKWKQKPTIELESERACFQSDPQKTNVYTRHFAPENISCHSVAFKCSLFSKKEQFQFFEKNEKLFGSFGKQPILTKETLTWWCSAILELSLLERQLTGFFFFQQLIFSKRVLIAQTGTSPFFIHNGQSRAPTKISLVWTGAGPWFFY